MMSRDLGNNGHEDKILELVLPIYVAEKHGPGPGGNLLEACLRSGKYNLGMELIQEMRSQG